MSPTNIFNFNHIKSAVDFSRNNLKAEGQVFVWKAGEKFSVSENTYPLMEGDELIYKGRVFDFTELVKD